MSPNMSVKKITVNDNPIYIQLKWTQNEENLFEMRLYDGNYVWAGVFTNESAEKIKQKYENPENYSDDVKKCLTGDDQSYSFKFVPEDSLAEFSWTKKFEGLTQVMGSVTLHRDISLDKLSFLDFLIDENIELKHKLANFEQSYDIVNKELSKCKSELETFLNSKIALENSLYGKFVQLLNTKKRRIQILEDTLQSFGNCSNED